MLPGPLILCKDNPRYVATPDGKALYLTGSHTWATLHDRLLPETPLFDYSAWLDLMEQNGQNFLRLWAWEHAAWMQFTSRKVVYGPLRYRRTGPGVALDGGPKFDLTKFNDDFFDRLRTRVIRAGERGIYVAVMFFQGFSVDKRKTDAVADGNNAFEGHPMHKDNNVNGIDGDPNGSGKGHQVHTLDVPEIVTLHETFVKRVIDELNDLDHIVWEISNETHKGSVAWQYHLIRFIQEYEKTKPKQHLVGMSGSPIDNPELFASPADWVGPKGRKYVEDPPQNDGAKVVVHDTDHTLPFDVNPQTPWRSFLRGLHFISMDGYMDCRFDSPGEPVSDWKDMRKQMGYTRQWSERVNLNAVVPRGDLVSTAFCLADVGREYLVYVPDGGLVDVNLVDVEGGCSVEWFNPSVGTSTAGTSVLGGEWRQLCAPFVGHAVLYLLKK